MLATASTRIGISIGRIAKDLHAKKHSNIGFNIAVSWISMSPSEAQKLLDLAKAWETAAESHKKEMRRHRSFAQPGKENCEFYIAKAAHDEIKAQLCESHSNRLKDLVNELLSSDQTVVPEATEA